MLHIRYNSDSVRQFVAIAVFLAVPLLAQAAPNRRELKAADLAYKNALKLEQQNNFTDALASLREAAQLAPGNSQYASAVAEAQQKLAYEHIQNAQRALNQDDRPAALREFSAALEFDPGNDSARQGLRQAAAATSGDENENPELVAESEEVKVEPKVGAVSLHFAGDSQALLTQLATSFGLTASFDDDFPSRALTLELNNASFNQAIETATMLTHTMWVPRSHDEIFFAPNTPEKHRDFDRTVLRTFYLPNLSTPAQLNDIASVLRSIFDVRFVVLNAHQSLITIRGAQPTIDAASEFLEKLNTAPPQVMLDVRVYEVDGTFARDLGLQIPSQFQLINIPPSLLALAAEGNIQQQINNIIASGGLTAANQQAINALLAQLQAQQNSALTSLLNTPFITFGKGQTLFAVTVPGISGNISFNSSMVQNLQNASLRVANNTSASLLVGTRYPVLTSSFHTPFANPGLVAPPIFNYEDLGVSLKAKPQVDLAPALATGEQAMAEVTLDLELSIKALSSTTFNDIPVIANREYKGSVRLKDGEAALVVGAVTRSRQRARSGLPGFGYIPLLGSMLTVNNTNNEDDEVLVIVTPHIIRLPDVLQSQSIIVPAGQ